MKTKLIRIAALIGFVGVFAILSSLGFRQLQLRYQKTTEQLAKPQIIFLQLPKFNITRLATVVRVNVETVKIGGVDHPKDQPKRINRPSRTHSSPIIRLVNQREKP